MRWGASSDRIRKGTVIASVPQAVSWLLENGPRELELLLRTIVFYPAAPILLADNDRHHREASVGASKLLGLPREKIIGRCLDEFAAPASQRAISEQWHAFLEKGEQEGTLQIVGRDGGLREVEYSAKGYVLPLRHVLALHEKKASIPGTPVDNVAYPLGASAKGKDYALSLLDREGRIVVWYAGSERIYGYKSAEVASQHASLFTPGKSASYKLQEELKRATNEGHTGAETWHEKKDGSRFWANVITMSLKSEDGRLHGFARVVRDFSERHEKEEQLQRSRKRSRSSGVEAAVAGIISGEFDRIPEANDAFLELVGYTREDLRLGRLNWHDLTPTEYLGRDELAHEEAMQFGACTPFEKELIAKNGERIPVLVATAILKLSPFRWLTFIQDLRDRNQPEKVDTESFAIKQAFQGVLGSSIGMRRVIEQVEVVAPTDATVLLLGETGTGKELLARAVHKMSPRRNLPFVTLNCAAIPTGLLESELFGYERGAFTGALTQKIGRFELAHQGTLFLDEVGDIPLELQPKLLRALQEKSFERLGGTRTIPIDVRLVAATNRNLTEMMGDKLFRSDLYYRLRVFPITITPLRDRPEDIPTLVEHFTRIFATKMKRQVHKIPQETMCALVSWSWPGNVRELENFIERSVILSKGITLCAPLDEIPTDVVLVTSDETLKHVEREHIIRILRETGGVVTQAAKHLGLRRTTLTGAMKRLGIARSDLSI